MAAKASDEERVAQLIERAIRGLPARDQTTILRYLLRAWLDVRLGRGAAQPPSALEGAFQSVELAPVVPQLSVIGVGRAHQTLPVRLPEEQYARLKEWCSQQGFSMATVIRGLVERFLEAQGLPTSRE